jgi:uncharacterized membrane-anchored protein
MGLVRVLFLLLVCAAPVQAQAPGSRDANYVLQELQKLAWQKGPGEGAIGSRAKIRIAPGLVFLDDKGTRRFLELMGNPPRDGHYLLAPASLDWFAVFSFDPVGYVKDDEKIDPDGLLEALKKSDGPGNEERKRLGMAPIYVDGWHVPPHYDTQTKRLEWGMRLRDEGGRMNVNYTSRLLGRTGVMSAVLVSSPANLERDMKDFRAALGGFQFASGERYAEFKPGDRVAEYGLGALVLGGAAAAAAKAGLFKTLGKFLWLLIPAFAGLWPWLKKKFSRGKDGVPPP